MSAMDRWIMAVSSDLGLDPGAEDARAILDMTRDVAHNVDRPGRPGHRVPDRGGRRPWHAAEQRAQAGPGAGHRLAGPHRGVLMARGHFSLRPSRIWRRGNWHERSRQRGADRGFQKAPLAGDGGLPLHRERGFELIEHGVKAADHLRRVGAIADDLGQGKHEQAVEVPQLPLDPYRAAGINPQAGRIESVARDAKEVADAIDGLYSCRRIVDGRRQRAIEKNFPRERSHGSRVFQSQVSRPSSANGSRLRVRARAVVLRRHTGHSPGLKSAKARDFGPVWAPRRRPALVGRQPRPERWRAHQRAAVAAARPSGTVASPSRVNSPSSTS